MAGNSQNSAINFDTEFPSISPATVETSASSPDENIVDPPKPYTPLEEIKNNYWLFILSLYGDPSLARKKAEFVAKSSSKIILDILNSLKHLAEPLIVKTKKQEFNEKGMLASLGSRSCYNNPESITIVESVSDTMRHRLLTLANKKSTVVKMNITFLFKSFFELPGMFDACTSYITELENDNNNIIRNVIHGTAWKNRKTQFGNKIMIPFCLYHDDFEPGSTLGWGQTQAFSPSRHSSFTFLRFRHTSQLLWKTFSQFSVARPRKRNTGLKISDNCKLYCRFGEKSIQNNWNSRRLRF